MKLAEALINRADIQKRLAKLKERILRNAKTQEGEQPPENPIELVNEFNQMLITLEDLIVRVNRTNSKVMFDETNTLSDVLAKRDILSQKQVLSRELAAAATITQTAYTKNEVKFKSTINVAQEQAKADMIAKEFRELDLRIQEQNWKIELL